MESVDIITTQAVTPRMVFGIFKRRFWVILLIMAVSLGTAAYITHITPKRWRANSQIILIQRSATVVGTAQQGTIAPMVETPETEIALLSSITMAQRAIDWMKSSAIKQGTPTDDIPANAEQLSKQISASVVKDTNLIDLLVDADSRAKAERYAGAVCNAFVDWKKQVAQEDVQDTTHNLEIREGRARQQLLEAEREETDFKLTHHLADVPVQMQATLNQYIACDAQVATDKQDLLSQEARLDAIGANLKDTNGKILTSLAVRDDAQVLALQQQLNSLELERYTQSLKVTPEYPGVLPDLDNRIADVKQRVATAIKNTLDEKKPSLQNQGAMFEDLKQAQINLVFGQAKFHALVKQRDDLRSHLNRLPVESMAYAKLARATEEARTIHSSLMTSLNMMRINSDISSGNVQISQEPFVPEEPYRPNLQLSMLTGGAIGLVLSLACMLLIEHSDRRIRDVDQVRRLVPGGVIGILPQLSLSERRTLLKGTPSPQVAETYSLACANLSLAVRKLGASEFAEPAAHQIVLITSALPGEGKSITAALMARSLATAGKRTILVDADMRRPTQNKLFQTDEPIGLADVLEERVLLKDALVQSDLANLHILHSGSPREVVTRLICRPEMGETLQALQEVADFVIIDAPACSVVADALFLAPHADCILHVTSVGVADEDLTRHSIQALQAAAPATMAHFVNRAPRNRHYAYKSYYGYGYHGTHRKGASDGAQASPKLTSAESDTVQSDPNDATDGMS